MIRIIGWDIGAANVKAARLAQDRDRNSQARVARRPFEIWRDKDCLLGVLQEIFASVSAGAPPDAMAVTMTAELSDVFATKREGVLFVLNALKTCFPEPDIYALSLSCEFVPLNEALTRPIDFAAANWLATAQWIGRKIPNCLLIDVGGTTTDILPILDGQVNVVGRSDLARLSSGELIYTGALRTNLAAIVQHVPVSGQLCRVASEYFAVSGDVHLILGCLQPQDYTCTTPDGQPPSIDSARQRLARLVCADTEMLSTAEIDGIARYIHDRQVDQIRNGLHQVVSRLPRLSSLPTVVLGSGSFLGTAAARSMGLDVQGLPGDWGKEELAAAPCLAAAYLLAEHLEAGSR